MSPWGRNFWLVVAGVDACGGKDLTGLFGEWFIDHRTFEVNRGYASGNTDVVGGEQPFGSFDLGLGGCETGVGESDLVGMNAQLASEAHRTGLEGLE